MQLFQAHAQIGTQCRFGNITGVQHLQVIPSQLQTQFHCARILIGAPWPTRSRVSAD
jgi:hypothetical protein